MPTILKRIAKGKPRRFMKYTKGKKDRRLTFKFFGH
jgi:hypothetical protein